MSLMEDGPAKSGGHLGGGTGEGGGLESSNGDGEWGAAPRKV